MLDYFNLPLLLRLYHSLDSFQAFSPPTPTPHETWPIKKTNTTAEARALRQNKKKEKKTNDSTRTKTPDGILLHRRESRIWGGGFPAVPLSPPRTQPPGDARGRGKPPFPALVALTLNRRVWRLLRFPMLPSTVMPLFEAQADWATTTVPSGLPWMKQEHCTNETERMESASPEQARKSSAGAFFPSFKLCQRDGGMRTPFLSQMQALKRSPGLQDCAHAAQVPQLWYANHLWAVYGSTCIWRIYHQPVSRQTKSDQNSQRKACILN